MESFKANYPTLCRDRNIIVIDNTRFKNPGLDYSLRGHLGIHPETLRGIVESEHFEVTNAPLRRLRSDKPNLVIKVCKSGRHRTVGNSEAQRDPIQDLLYDDDRSRPKVEVFHLQAETDWSTLCDSDCPSCNLTSKANRLNLAKAYDRLKGIIPSRTTEAASTSAPKTATTGEKKKARTQERSDTEHSENLKKKVNSLVNSHDDYTSMLVIQSICDCLNVKGGLFQLVSQHVTPVNCLVYLIEQYERTFEAIERVYAAAARDATLGTVSAAVALECFDITDVALDDQDIADEYYQRQAYQTSQEAASGSGLRRTDSPVEAEVPERPASPVPTQYDDG
mgnify:FL=1